MALIHRSFGMTGVVVFFSFLISLASFLLFKSLDSDDNSIIISISVVLFAICTSEVHWLARPHIFSLVLLIVWHHLLDSYQYKSINHLYTLPIIMIAWVNLHGGFMGGFILLGVYLLGNLTSYLRNKDAANEMHLERIKLLGLTTAACVAVTVINPYGYQILLFPFKLTLTKEIMDTISEFTSPNFHESYARLFEFFLLSTIAVFAFSRFRLNTIESMSVILFLHMALYSARYIPLFAIIAAPILSRQLNLILGEASGKVAGFIRKKSCAVSAINAAATGNIWPATSIVLIMSSVVTGKIEYKFDERIKPMAAIEFLKAEKITGNMFNNDEFGDCLIYSAYPMYKVFFDGRSDMYGPCRLKEYNEITRFGQGWETILKRYRISWVFFDADSALSRHLLIHKDWKLIYADKVANIFVKDIPEYRHLIDKYPAVKPVLKAVANDSIDFNN
jgi:hypothetical protein